ncbi:C2H2 transcription factor [Pleurostoma richardsiae]|uniref:C2H2 type master regulator of conidiophore development brlA n=1 Tax=Pleurostoma richardsiae TaxID=41990 RepID=A0AA38S7H0_9PEZI|nr:C2H2 transcription factor [Pleurostoma richardsiae]
MHTRDATGRKVSLLNDEPVAQPVAYYDAMPQRSSYSATSHIMSQPFQPSFVRSGSSSPNTPELLRSDSYDSNASNEPISPLTPSMMYPEYNHGAVYVSEGRSPYDEYPTPLAGTKRPSSFGGSSRSGSYDEDEALGSGTAAPERSAKRYPCRFRDSHGCEKTFTTSGHASRHSKIHTAEKAVQCTFPGCAKKFTRADNMKQHLETHYKDKSRNGSARPSVSARRHSSSSKASTTSKSSAAGIAAPLPSPGLSGGAWDMRGLNLPLLSRPSAARTPSSGLDALAMAIACQEGA